jgi:regulator of protease activity HflC (stomatin/prohibitin superfamily)
MGRVLRIVGGMEDAAPLSPLGRFVDDLVQAFENRRPGLKDEALAPADAEAYFAASFEAERGRLREALRLADPQLGVQGRERLAGEIAAFVGSTLVPAYGRLAARFTEGERNDFYVLRGPLRALERIGFAAAGLLGGGFLVWAPFIPLWSKHWIWLFRRPRAGGRWQVRRWLLPVILSTSVGACSGTSSTEIGIRTNLIGLLEARGHQQLYQPGSMYFVMPIVNAWHTLSIAQQNLLMNANPDEGDRPVPDDVTFKTRDGNNVHIDVNIMWRIDPLQAGMILTRVGTSVDEIKERVVRPVARSVIRDVFNEITSEEYYHVTVKNRMADKARDALIKELTPFGILVDMLQVQEHRFDPAYQAAINAQKQAEADMQALVEQQKNMEVQKATELAAKRADWNRLKEEALGDAGRRRNEADGYYQTATNKAKSVLVGARAEADAVRMEAAALNKLGGEAYVKMQVAKLLGGKRITIVPASNVSTMNVNGMLDFLVGQNAGRGAGPRAGQGTGEAAPEGEAK